MHLIVTAIGSAGDINPLLMIAAEIRSRGHDVDFIANAYFERKIRDAGLSFLALGTVEDYQRAVDDPEMWEPEKGFQAVWRTLREALPLNLDLIESRLRQDTVLIGSTLAFASRIAQEKHGTRGSTIHLAPSCVISGHEPMAMPGISWLPKMPLVFRQWMMSTIDSFWLDGICKQDLNDFRAQHGLSPIKSVMKTWMHSPDQVICAFPEWYAKPQPDWPPHTVMTGFPVYDRPEDQSLTPELEQFLQSGEAPLVFTAGSAMAHAKAHFRTAVEATKLAGMRAVLVSAYPDQIPASLPSNILYVPYAPFAVLFPRAAVVQHHGGIGTSAQCLAAGVPHLVSPFAHDQFDNASRLRHLGVAKETNSLNPMVWKKSLEELAHNPNTRQACEQIKERMKLEPRATELIAMAVEKLRTK
jgi:rhamnosyltransferase subunit B